MKAVVISEIGSIDNLQIEEVAEPEAQAGEAVLAVRAGGLNHLDLWVALHRGGQQGGRHLILGSDVCGVVTAVGQDVTSVKVGDEVIANPGMSCGRCEFCADGEESLCTSFGIMGLSRPGSFAEKVALPAECLAAKPAHLTDEEAAALPLAHLTAWRMLMSRARVQSGETVLIHGIGGGVALAALQISLLAGAQTIVTSSSADKLSRAAALGAHHTLNYAETEDLAKEVLVLTAGRGVDVAFDTVGAGTLPINIQALRKGGRMVLCGVTGGSQGEIDLQQVYWKQLSILGSTMGSQGEFTAMVEAVSRHQVKPVMDCALPMERAREAFARMEKGDQFGKIVLRIR